MNSNFSLENVGREITFRTESLFAKDIAEKNDVLNAKLNNSRILIIGGGGSIGSETVKLLVKYPLKKLTVVDTSENYLADLIRNIRSDFHPPLVKDIEVIPIDYTGPQMAKYLQAQNEQYDYVLNFAALKHVRSEKDLYSLLQMFHINITGQYLFKESLNKTVGSKNYFAVSTDKASNPTSLMGASKRIMEDVIFDTECANITKNSSTRFANVAFSNGSLPLSFVDRIAQNQPLVAPKDTRRYFVTLKESGQICLLSAILGEDQSILVPNLDAETCLVTMEKVATTFLEFAGYKPYFTESEEEAKAEVETLKSSGQWPVLVTPLDTSGEKPYEEFVAAGETVVDINLQSVKSVQHIKSNGLDELISTLKGYVDATSSSATVDDISQVVSNYLPSFKHKASNKSLDDRM